MQINRCINCESEIESYPCPHCGFDPVEYQQPSYALPCGYILQGRYLIGKVLGQGGFGITYVGWDLALQFKCAVKEFYPNGQAIRDCSLGLSLYWSGGEQARELRQKGVDGFLKEARKMTQVDQIPEIVRVRDTFLDNDTAYIVMDFVEGETLKRYLADSGPIGWEEAKQIFFPVISAMEKVHQAGLVHRDLSPDNLMLMPDGEVRILDLGSAKDLTAESGMSSVQVVKGGFSPVEQYGQSGASGPWTDVYAMAATMYFALTGTMPPLAVDRMYDDTLSWELPQLRTVPKHVITAMKNALAVNLSQRTQTMGEFLQQMRRAYPEKKKIKTVLACACAGVLALAVCFSGIHTHKWVPASCTEPKTCSVCGKTEGVPLGHSWQEADCEHSKACQICGKTEGDPLGHDWIEATWDEPKACRRCKKTEGSPLQLSDKNKEIMALAVLGAGRIHSVALSNGRVLTAGDNESGQISLKNWHDLIAVAGGDRHTVGLKADGTVVAAGQEDLHQCEVQSWRNVVAIAAGDYHTVALCANGALLATGWNTYGQCRVDELSAQANGRKIIEIAAGYEHTVALLEDGTVAAIGNNRDGQCNVFAWTDIVAVWAGTYHTVGLKKDGTVVAVGKNDEGQCNVDGWKRIVNLCVGDYHTVGVKSDGTVTAVGRNTAGQCDLYGWNQIVTVAAGRDHTVGLCADGTAVAAGRNNEGQCEVTGWTKIS